MSDIAIGQDADFSEERLVSRYNSDLANSLGNLVSRTLTMAEKYCQRVVHVPEKDVIYRDPGAAYEGPFRRRIEVLAHTCKVSFEGDSTKSSAMDVAIAMMQPVEIAVQCNRFIEEKAPWKLAKHKSPQAATEINAVLYTVAESLRIIAILISPVLPKAAHGIFDQLNWKMDLSGKEERFSLADAKWGGLPDGHVVGKPVPLFPRIETD